MYYIRMANTFQYVHIVSQLLWVIKLVSADNFYGTNLVRLYVNGLMDCALGTLTNHLIELVSFLDVIDLL